MSGFDSGFTDDEENDYQKAILKAALAKILMKNESGAARGQAGAAVDAAPEMSGDRMRSGAMGALMGNGGLPEGMPTDPRVNKESPFWKTEPGTDMDSWWSGQQSRMDRKYARPSPGQGTAPGQGGMDPEKLAMIKAMLGASSQTGANAVGNAMEVGMADKLNKFDKESTPYAYMHGTGDESSKLSTYDTLGTAPEAQYLERMRREAIARAAAASAAGSSAVGQSSNKPSGAYF